ncbi:MAG: flagellar hook-length control protein FliK [Lachnospiraceae bacterium]|nr:flagellar hook-length control protein FliK [Lachnospiraceae bacterium]
MTSANVSQIPNGIVMNTQAKSAAKSQGTSTDFMSMVTGSLQNNSASSESSESIRPPQKSQTLNSFQSKEAPAQKIPTENETSLKKSPEETEEIVEATNDFVKEVVNVISEEMDVSEEEVIAACETLGLSFMDLTDPSNITKLLAELTGDENNVSLILNDTVSNILSQVEPMIQNLFETTGVNSSDEFKQLLTQNDLEEFGFKMEETPINLGPNGEVFGAAEPKEEVLPNQILNSNPVIHPVESESIPLQDTTEIETTVVVEVSDTIPKEKEISTDVTTDNSKILEAEESDVTASVTKVEEADTNSSENDGFEFNQNLNKNPQSAFQEHSLHNVVADTSVNVSNSVSSQPNVSFASTVSEVTTSYTSINVEDIMEQIVTQTRTIVADTSTTMELELHPASLGKMYLQVTENEGTISAKLYTENNDVKTAMETQMIALKENWNQQGLKVNSVEISVGTREFEEQLDNQSNTAFENGSNSFAGSKDGEESSTTSRMRNINLNSLDELPEDMSEEEALAASMMRDSGNSVNFTA